MRQGKDDGSRTLLYILGLIPAAWLGLLAAPYLGSGLSGLIEGFSEAMAKPFHITWCENSLKGVLGCIAVYLIGIAVYSSSTQNYRRGEEHGSAHWGSAYKIKRKYADNELFHNKILTQNSAISLNSRKHQRNLNVLVVGGSGSGKTRSYAKPNIMQANTSYVVLDPKGEILRDTGNLLQISSPDFLTCSGVAQTIFFSIVISP